MKTLGLIGGISWVSTAEYYRLINLGINERLGELNFSQCIIHSFNYQDIKENNDNNDWGKTLEMITAAVKNLGHSGAQGVILCANTMHLIADRLQEKIQIPIVHIAVATAKEIRKKGLKKVALLGTRFTMELDFFTDKLAHHGIKAIIPATEEERAFIQQTIYEELGRGIAREETKRGYLKIIEKLITQGAEGVILGCTEIPLIISQSDVSAPVFDTTRIHANAAVEFALQ